MNAIEQYLLQFEGDDHQRGTRFEVHYRFRGGSHGIYPDAGYVSFADAFRRAVTYCPSVPQDDAYFEIVERLVTGEVGKRVQIREAGVLL